MHLLSHNVVQERKLQPRGAHNSQDMDISRGRRTIMTVLHDAHDAHDAHLDAGEQVEDLSAESAPMPTLLTEPLSPLETRRANAEALERAPQSSESVSEARRRGRIEAETRRISEEITRLAQEQRRAEEVRAPQQVTDTRTVAGTAPSAVTAIPSDASHPLATADALCPISSSCQFQRILAPLDGTFYAERALPYATALARLTGAELLLGYVRPPSPPAPSQEVGSATAEMLSAEREPHATDVQAYLDALRVLQAFHAPTVRVDLIEQRDAAVGVRMLAEQDSADVVVLATHARHEVERQALGSTVNALVARSHFPLLVISSNVIVQPEPTFENVLVPLDGSLLAEHALDVLLGLIHAAASSGVINQEEVNWQITLFRVVVRRALMGEALAYLDEVEAWLRASGLPQETRISKQVQLGSARGAIVDAANHGASEAHSVGSGVGSVDLLALATHGRGGMGRLLYGSVARYVLSRVAAPVLLVHPADTEG
jgi:nucleotide-binding universal stress UspA family protein